MHGLKRTFFGIGLGLVAGAAVAQDDPLVVDDPLSEAHRQPVFELVAMPWDQHLARILAQVDARGLGEMSRIAGLAEAASCQADLVAGEVIGRFGRAFLDGQAHETAGRTVPAAQSYSAAIAELGTLAKGLTCLDFLGIHLWDHAVASAWRAAAEDRLPGTDLGEMLRATWNPALLIADYAQMSGHSEIVAFLQTRNAEARQSQKPVSSGLYGGVWLDNFGTGKLVQIEDAQASSRLLDTFEAPVVLGLGTCPFTMHATGEIDGSCVLSLAPPTCETGSLGSVLGMLAETGLLNAVVQGKINAEAITPAGSGAPLPSAGIQRADARLGYFGNPISTVLGKACGRLSHYKPRDVTSAISLFAPRTMPPGAQCVFETVEGGLSEPGGEHAARAVSCLQQFRVSPELPTGTEFSLPMPDCTVGGNADLDTIYDRLKHYELVMRFSTIQIERAREIGTAGTVELMENMIIAADRSWEDWVTHWVVGEPLAPIPNDRLRVTKVGDQTIRVEFTDTGEVYHYDIATGETRKITPPTTEEPSSGVVISVTQPGRPIEPETCNDTAALQRARAIFNCMFGAPEADPDAGPAPVSQPVEPGSAPPPESCDEVSDQAFWGSSTGAGAGRPLNPEDLIGGGPTILPFIPEIQGPIDPEFLDGRLFEPVMFDQP